MADNYECDKCGEEFDSERGLHIHIGQVHEEEVDDDSTEENTEPKNTEETGGSGKFPLDERGLQIPVELALFSVFVLGLAVGLSSGLLAAGSGFDLGTTGTAPPTDTGSNGGNGGDGGTGSPGGSDSSVSVQDMSNDDDPVLGEDDAPVTMVMWEDYQCPFCKRFETNSFPKIKKNYVDTGKVKIVWKDFPLPDRIHPWADTGAQTMECVYREAGKNVFWTLKDKIFQNQESITDSNAESKIIQWAVDEGASRSAINSCLDSGVSSEIQEDMKQGQDRGISGTPGFAIYKSGSNEATKVVGAQPYSRFVEVIDNKLGE